MDWWSEMALIWLPVGRRAYPGDFAQRDAPGTSDYYYALYALYALYAFDAINSAGRRKR